MIFWLAAAANNDYVHDVVFDSIFSAALKTLRRLIMDYLTQKTSL
jgi:hypothetical protein